MITYFESNEEKHLNDLYVHLRAHNKSFTGDKVNETMYIYVLKDDRLLGGMKTNLSWDWVGLSEVFYQDDAVLNELLAKACTIYKERAMGFKLITKDKTKHHDFIRHGFYEKGIVTASPQRGTNFFSELTNLDKKSEGFFHTISSKDIVNEYDIISKEKVKEYEQTFNDVDPVENIGYYAYDNEEFVGGIKLDLYEDSLYIHLLAVNKKYRGLDIGTTLMTYAEKIARDRNMVSMDVGTTEFQARPFYEKLGYKVILTRQNQPKGFENYTLIKILDY